MPQRTDELATFFPTPAEWRRWLEANHETAPELWVGFHRKGTGHPSMTWHEAVGEALCFGWIDGLTRRIDEARWRIRFTPRRKGSTWSEVNVRRVAELQAAGLMRPAGLRAFEARSADRTGTYAFEQKVEPALAPADEARLRADPAAWAFFQSCPAGYRRAATWWVVSAKREETRERRLVTLLTDSAAGRRLRHLAPERRTRG